MTDLEREIILLYRQLNPACREVMMTMISEMKSGTGGQAARRAWSSASADAGGNPVREDLSGVLRVRDGG